MVLKLSKLHPKPILVVSSLPGPLSSLFRAMLLVLFFLLPPPQPTPATPTAPVDRGWKVCASRAGGVARCVDVCVGNRVFLEVRDGCVIRVVVRGEGCGGRERASYSDFKSLCIRSDTGCPPSEGERCVASVEEARSIGDSFKGVKYLGCRR